MRTTKLNLLTDRKVRNAPPGLTADGGGLYIRRRGENLTWMFRYSFDGKRRETGFGAYPTVSLADARQRAAQARQALARGDDPKSDNLSDTPSDPRSDRKPTFRQATDRYLALRSAEWSNSKHSKQWPSSLNTYAGDLMGMAVDTITTRDIAACLTPIWQTKGETASRVRQRIERILSSCIALGERTGPNPAALPDNLALVLGKQVRTVRHHAAVPVADAPEAFARLWRCRDAGQGARGLLMVCLTVLRSGEVRHMEWTDLSGDTIVIPADRMKARRAHRVPVVPMVGRLLDEWPRWSRCDLVLPAARGGPISDATMAATLRRVGLGQYTPHGWRSTFSDWAHESGWNHRWVEDALAHRIGTDVERAYRRGDYLEQRRDMMDSWAKYLMTHVN